MKEEHKWPKICRFSALLIVKKGKLMYMATIFLHTHQQTFRTTPNAEAGTGDICSQR